MKNKKWEFTKPKKDNSWSIFKIMGEFVEGYEKLSAIGPCISFCKKTCFNYKRNCF